VQELENNITTVWSNKQLRSKLIAYGVFILIGFGLLYMRLIPWLVKAYLAKSWQATPCRVLSANVGVKNSTDSKGRQSTSYYIDVYYEYTFKGKKYQSYIYGVVDSSNSAYKSKQRIVERYRTQPNSICYVNPACPEQAVLNRELSGLSFWALTICSTLAWVGGLIGAWITIRNYRRKKALAGNYDYARVEERFKHSESIPLKVKKGPIQQFVVIVFAAIFFNGITSIFLVQVIENFSNDLFGWLRIAFIIPFVFFGLVFIVAACYEFTKLFAPIPEVHIDKNIVSNGDTLKIFWCFMSRCVSLENLDIELVCVESIIKTKTSKNNSISQNDVMTIRVAQLSDNLSMQTGEVTGKVPADAQVSILDDYPRYNWYIRFSGKIAKRPKFKFDYEFAVIPPRLE